MAKIKRRFIPKHMDGHYITIMNERTKEEDRAARFHTAEETQRFLNGQFGPQDPENYKVVPLEITYREVEENEREHESI
jgi:hypothetical protein